MGHFIQIVVAVWFLSSVALWTSALVVPFSQSPRGDGYYLGDGEKFEAKYSAIIRTPNNGSGETALFVSSKFLD